MGSTKTVVAVICMSLLDAVASFLLFIHGDQLKQTLEEVVSFTIKSNMLDLWVLSIIRVSVSLGSSIGVLLNRRDGPIRVRKSETIVTVLSGMMVVYAIVKLLLRSELPHWYKDIWFWILMTWTVLASLTMRGCWELLGKVKSRINRPVVLVNSTNEMDQEYLVESTSMQTENDDDSDDTSEEGGSEKDEMEKGSRRTLLRLFSYSKPDIPYILVGFVGLLVSSASK